MVAGHPLLRLQAARALAWALLLGGWVGIGSVAQVIAASPLSALGLVALWLLAIGAFVAMAGRIVLSRAVHGLLLVVSAAGAAYALPVALDGGGLAALLPVVLGTAGAVALASAAVRACRRAACVPAGPPVAAAAIGALLACACLGDITDLRTLVQRLAVGLVLAAGMLALLLPRRAGVPGTCRAGLFDCSMPAWDAAEWRVPAARPGMLAQLAMLPMMCGLPWMAALCRTETVPAQAVVGVHVAAMFVPALLVANVPALRRGTTGCCALLLGLGAVAWAVLPGPTAWWVLVLLHGSAWGVAWASRLLDRAPRGTGAASAVGGSVLNSALVLGLGAGMSLAGLDALAAWQAAIGAAAAFVVLGTRLQRMARAWP